MAITPCIDKQVTGGLCACFLATSKVRAASQRPSYSTFEGPWVAFLSSFGCFFFLGGGYRISVLSPCLSPQVSGITLCHIIWACSTHSSPEETPVF